MKYRNFYKEFNLTKNMKRKSLMIFSLMIIGLFMISSMVPLVSAAGGWLDDLGSSAKTWFSGLFDSSSNTGIDIENNGFLNDEVFGQSFARFLLMFIVVMLVYTVLEFVGLFGKKDWVNWVISAGIGILSFSFVNVDLIQSLILQYEAMGVIITAVLPAIIIFGFSLMIKKKELEGDTKPSVFLSLLSKGILIGYGIYLLIRSSSAESSGVRVIFVIIALFMIVVGFFESSILKSFHKKEHKIKQEKELMEGEDIIQALGSVDYKKINDQLNDIGTLDELKLLMKNRNLTHKQKKSLEKSWSEIHPAS